MKVYSFEKLECWKNARQLAFWVYKVTANFPADERYGMTSQMRRASISVASNISEGCARASAKDQARFNTFAYSSAIELLNQLIISNDLSYISNEILEEGRNKIEITTYQIAQLKKYQLSQVTSKISKSI
jgi:four helix bundle protein